MSQPNVTVVVGKPQKKKGKTKNVPTTNSFWSQINNPSIAPTQSQPLVRSLTEVQMGTPQPKLIPPKPALVDLVHGNSPHIPSIALNTTNSTSTMMAGNKNPAPIIAASMAKNITTNIAENAANMTKLNAAKQIAAKNVVANHSGYSTSTNQPNANQPKMFTNQQEKKWQKFQVKIQKKLGKQRKYWDKKNAYTAGNQPEETTDNPENEETKDIIPENTQAKPTTVADIQAKPMTLKSKKALQKEMAKQRQTWQMPNPKALKTNHGTNNDPQKEETNEIMAPNKAPQVLEAPKPSPRAVPITGFSDTHIFEVNIPPVPQITPMNPRSNAGSFFKQVQQQQLKQQQPKQKQPKQQQPKQQQQQPKQQQQQPKQQQQQPMQPKPSPNKKGKPMCTIYAYNYPKGIPTSFLVQQKIQQEAGNQIMMAPDAPIWPTAGMNFSHYNSQSNTLTLVQTPNMPIVKNPAQSPIFVQTENQPDVQQPYSPSDIYSECGNNTELCEDSQSSEMSQSGQKRLSAFQRLGPLSQPKKPKLTINLTLNKEQPVREVVNDTDDDPDRYTPVHLRQDIIMSTDETVMKYLPFWPWRKNVGVRRSATARNSRTVMILEQEQMEEAYEKDNYFIQITVKGYPSTWTKERVLDAILDSVKGYSLIPCFTEFYQHECKFLTLRSRSALIILHKTGFYIHRDGVELTITISQTDLSLNQIDFIPRIILRKRVSMGYLDKKLNLSAFTLQDDISHFIYFPLNRVSNQSEFTQLQSVIAWDHLTELDISHNRLTNISGFDLSIVTPRLKHLNLSFNYLEKITSLLSFRELPLKKIHLEGNPLCHDYIQPEHYIKVVKMMFPAVMEIDGVPIHRKGELPQFKQNFCPEEAKEVAEKFLDIFFPLLDSGSEHRNLIQGMYEDNATLTITYCYKLRYGQIYRCFRNLFLYARFLDEGETDSVVGAMAITKLINRWPHTEHDPFTFTVDVLYHTESTTILRVSGILKLTAETLAEDEHLLSFTRTVVLYSEHGDEYRIQNETVYWDEPTAECARAAFRVNTISQKKLNLKIESTTDEDLREKLLKIFMKLTTMDKKNCERCMEINNWNFKLALEHFTKLLKLNNLDSLTKEVVEV